MEGRTRTLIVTLLVLFTATYVQVDLLNKTNSSTLEEYEIASTIPLQTTHEWDIVSGNWYSIQTNCMSCTSELFINDVMIQSEQINYSGQINENGKLRLVIDNPQAENFAISAIVDVTDNHPNTRPGPQTEIQLSSVYHCNEPDHCIDKQSPNLAGLKPLNQTIQSINGVLESQQKDHFGFAVTQGQTVELNLEHVNSDIEIKSYFQNETNEFEIVNNLTSHSISNSKANPNLMYVNINEDGRLIISVSSETVDTIWSIGIMVYNQSQTSVIQLTEGTEILGHATKTIVIEMNDTTAINLQPNIFDVNYTYQSLVNSEWVFSGNGVFINDVDNFIFPLPGSTATMLTISANVFHIDLTSTNFDDINSGLEAPSLPPILASTNNSSWPVLDVQGPNRIGEFTHSVGDSSDVYRIEIDAWEDSIHFVKIDIEGDINAFEIELIEKDQNDWSEVESKTKTITLGKLTVALELSRGTHFFRISMLNATANTAWGEYSEPTKYTIITTYELVDEGEEPWFPPDENAKKWGNIARWVMGILFLVPALYLVIAQTRKKNYAKEMSSKKQRLQWLKSRLDEGISPKQNRRELAKSLDAVATLDWDDACQTWGEADIYYRTENVAIACWRLDPRIAEDSESWPIIVGIYIVSGSWEIAALRLDSPEGQAWEIKSVTPRFLHGGYEVFLDTMLEGNKTFLSLELVGSANSVDIELNGRLNGEPFACRAAKTLYRDEEE
ncbi:MAG: hypothetical protein VXW28_00010 [Candidatus Thermoplasmatota archaeon]|nr:hypothetical protein [Candidatus Thermoplasmatota archaeon]